MGSVRFILRKQKENIEQSIFVAYNFDRNNKILYSTNYKIKPKFWNTNKQKIGNYTEVKDKDSINNSLNELKTSLESFLSNCQRLNTEITKDSVKQFLNEYFNPKEHTPPENNLFAFIESFINQSETRINDKTGKRLTHRTILEYKRTFEYLKKYAKKQKQTIDFKDIDLNFYYDFIKFLQSFKFATNTIGHKILTLKTFLNDATDKNINTNLAFKSPKFKVLKEDSDSIYLTEKELNTISKHDFSNNPKLERVRDIFLIGSYTGLRFSDLESINDNIIDNRIHIEQKKTGNKVVIPLHPIVKKIFEKYEYKLPYIISNQKFNQYIKEVCKIVGINETVEKSMTKGGLKVTENSEKWQRVGTHTARRSFATNLYKKGFPAISIMQITGHKTEDAFLKYIKVTPQEHADLLDNFWNNQTI